MDNQETHRTIGYTGGDN